MPKTTMPPRGFTMTEILVTLAISSVLLALSLIGLRGYLAKQHLSASAQNLASLLEKAQIQANQGLPVCLDFSNINTQGSVKRFIFPNNDATAMSATNACSSATTGIVDLGESSVLASDIKLATHAQCTEAAKPSCVLWIRKDGIPILCANSDGCASVVPNAGCTSVGMGHQFILTSASLDAGAKSKEVEITEAGLVNIPKIANKGYLTSVWAAFLGDGGGTGSCE